MLVLVVYRHHRWVGQMAAFHLWKLGTAPSDGNGKVIRAAQLLDKDPAS